MSETPAEQEQAEVEATAAPPAPEPAPTPEPAEAHDDAPQADVPQATTQGDLTPSPDEHPVDTTPPIAEGDGEGEAHEPMVHERGEPNERGAHGDGGTVWNG